MAASQDQQRVEAEMNARREKSDRTSSRMGELLLQGFCMMSDSCSKCNTPLMRARDKTVHCVTCEDAAKEKKLDTPKQPTEQQKEVSEKKTVRMITTEDSEERSRDAPQQAPNDQSHPLLTGMLNPPSQPAPAGITRSSANSPIHSTNGKDPQEIAVGLQVRYSCMLAAQAVTVKLQQASQMLAHAQNVNETVELCSVINACVNTIQNIQPLLR